MLRRTMHSVAEIASAAIHNPHSPLGHQIWAAGRQLHGHRGGSQSQVMSSLRRHARRLSGADQACGTGPCRCVGHADVAVPSRLGPLTRIRFEACAGRVVGDASARCVAELTQGCPGPCRTVTPVWLRNVHHLLASLCRLCVALDQTQAQPGPPASLRLV